MKPIAPSFQLPTSGPSLGSALRRPMPPGPERTAWKRLSLQATLALGVFLLIMVIWSLAAPLSGAVISTGFVKSEMNRKTVQHQEGGIVSEILVREGQRVKAGQPLVVVGDVRTDATLSLLKDQMASELTRKARLEAELRVASGFVPPRELADEPRATEYLSREQALFTARKKTLEEQVASLRAQIRDSEEQIAALQSQIKSTEKTVRLASEELDINNALLQQGFVQRTRILTLERAVAENESRVGEYRSDLAMAKQRIGDFQSRIVQARNQYQQQAADELKETATRISEIEERLRPSRDQVERQYVRSPVDGEVMSLRVGAAGTAIGPREPILDIVPLHEKLVIEVPIHPEDIDYVQNGAEADIRLTAYEYRRMPLLPGRIVSVSADRVEDSHSGTTWFNALVEVDADMMVKVPGTKLQAGMPAEVYITTPPRSLFDYLMQPLSSFASRGMREP